MAFKFRPCFPGRHRFRWETWLNIRLEVTTIYFFWPIDLDKDGGIRYRPVFPEASFERPLRVVHAPNHRQFKGTSYLEEAVTKLRSDGLNIELVLVERVPNEQALRSIAQQIWF